MTEENKLDAYGHLNWTVGNEDWIACFDARRNGDEIEYHVVVNCESGGFIDTLTHATVPIAEAVQQLGTLPDYWADICREHYHAKRGRRYQVKVRETRRTVKAWRAFISGLVERGPCTAIDPCQVCAECNEPGPDPVRDGWIGSDGRP